MRGFSLIEVIVYISILALITVVAVQSLLAVNGVLRQIRTIRSLNSAADIALERTIRVIRSARSVNELSSTFDASPGILSLAGSESPAVTYQFSVSGGGFTFQSGSNVSVLTPPGVVVTNLIFRDIATTTSKAIKIELTVAASNGKSTTTQNFYSTAILRNSYDQ